MLANPVPWPDGLKCCVSLTWDVDVESGLAYKHRERVGSLVSTRSFLRYEPTIALPRLMGVLADLEMRQTFFLPGWVIERYPGTVELLLENGHEIGLHGYLHERSHELSHEAEARLLERALGAYVRQVGHRPRGWRAPGFTMSPHSADLLIDAGFDYDSSLMGGELPSLLVGERGNLVEFPVDWTSDDWPQFMHSRDFDFLMQIASPARAMEVFHAEFEAMHRYGGHWITIWHSFLSGRLSRLSAVIDLIGEMRARGDVWFARLDEVSDHVRALAASGSWTPREDRLPFHDLPDID